MLVQKMHLMLFGYLVRMDESGEFLPQTHSSSEWLEKASMTSSHLLTGHNDEEPNTPQPQ